MTARPQWTGTALVLIAGLMVAACQTARLDNIAPQTAAPLPPPSSARTASTTATDAAAQAASTLAPTETAAAEQEEGRPPPGWPPPGAARDTGSYPNLNIPPPVATTQITDGEEAASKARLNALRQRTQGTSAPTVSGQGALRKLGQSHGVQALEEIEATGDNEEPAE